jgi:chitinase
MASRKPNAAKSQSVPDLQEAEAGSCWSSPSNLSLGTASAAVVKAGTTTTAALDDEVYRVIDQTGFDGLDNPLRDVNA